MYYVMLFSLILLIFSAYVRERKFDFLSVYVVFLVLYNLPTVFGVVVNPFTGTYLDADDSLIYSTTIIFLTTIPFLYFRQDSLNINNEAEGGRVLVKCVLWVILLTYLTVFFYYLPVILSSSTKKELIETGGNIYSYFGLLPVLGYILALRAKNKVFLSLFLFLVLFIFAFGSRRPLAILIVISFIYFFSGRYVSYKKYFFMAVLGLISLLFMVLGKSLYAFILRYGIEGLGLWASSFRWEYITSGSEFLGRTSILSAVINNNFTVGLDHILKSLLALQPIPMSYFGYSSSAFNEQFQHILFLDLDYGMAYNPWAEGYAWAGNLGILIYSLVICSGLHFLWKAYCNAKTLKAGIILVVVALITFWVHRNSLGSELAYIRNAFYPAIFCYFFGWFFYKILSRRYA